MKTMKKTRISWELSRRLAAIIALIAVIVFMAVGCTEPDPSDTQEQETSDVFRMVWQGEFDSAPANPVAGWVYFNKTDEKLYVYYDNVWHQFGADGAPGAPGADGTQLVWKGSYADSNATELATPEYGWLYYDTTAKASFIYLNGGWQRFAQDGINGTDGVNGATPDITFSINTDGDLLVTVGNNAPINIGTIKGPKGDPGEAGLPGANAYMVIFNSLSGDPLMDAVGVNHGGIVTPPPFEKDGYKIVGWYTDRNFDTPYNFSVPVTANITLYAKWEGFSFELIGETAYRVRKGSVYNGNVIIPDTHNGLPVTEIGSATDFIGAFEECNDITSTTIPASVKSISLTFF